MIRIVIEGEVVTLEAVANSEKRVGAGAPTHASAPLAAKEQGGVHHSAALPPAGELFVEERRTANGFDPDA